MKKIPLTQGKFALVDDENYEWLNQKKWHTMKSRNTFYAVRLEGSCAILMHREIMGLKQGDKRQIDHKTDNGLDNQIANLRICTNQQNQHNQKRQNRYNTSKYKGVSWHTDKWRAVIYYNKKQIRLGRYDSEIEAAKTYDKAARELFGEFARPNFKK